MRGAVPADGHASEMAGAARAGVRAFTRGVAQAPHAPAAAAWLAASPPPAWAPRPAAAPVAARASGPGRGPVDRGQGSVRGFASSSSAGDQPAPPDPDPEPGAALLAWLASLGGSAPGVTVAPSPLGGAGLVTTSAAQQGTLLVSVPRAALVSAGGLPPNPTPAEAAALPFSADAVTSLASAVPAELWGARLALGLLAHRAAGPASPVAPYLAALPATFSTPLFFSPAAVRAVQYAPLVAQIDKRARWVAAFARQHLADLGRDGRPDPFNGVTVDAGGLAWALSAVTSRAFRLGGPGSAPALVPVIDMCNHEGGSPGAKVVPGPGGSVTLVAARALAASAPVTISYGDALPNDDLLGDYGFMPDFGSAALNPADCVKFRLDAGLLTASAALAGVEVEEGSPAPWRLAAAAGAGVAAAFTAGGGAGVEAAITAAPPHAEPRLLAAARLAAAASPSDLGAGAGAPALLGDPAHPLASPPAEAAAWRLVAALCVGSLAAFPTTAGEDRAALAAGGLAPDVAAATALAAGKKELLAAAAQWAGAKAQAAEGGGGGGGGGGGPKARGPPRAATAKGFGRKAL